MTLELDDAARTWLANKGYDPAYGARPLEARHPEARCRIRSPSRSWPGKHQGRRDRATDRARRQPGDQRPAGEGGRVT